MGGRGLVAGGLEWAGDLVGHEFDENTLDTVASGEAAFKDTIGVNSALFAGSKLLERGAPFLGKAGPIGAMVAGGMNVLEGGAGLLDGEWNQDDWGNAGKVAGGAMALGAGGLMTFAAGSSAAVAAPYLAAGAATIGLGMRGNSAMNQHLGYGYGDAMGYGEGVASHATDALSGWMGLEEDSFAAGALGVAGGVADVGIEMLTNPIGSAIDGGTLGLMAGLGIAEDVVNFGGGFFGSADAGTNMVDALVGEGTIGNSILDGASTVGDWLSPNQWAGAAMDWLGGGDDD